MALVKVQISATEAGAGITQTKGTAILTIGGSSRTIDVYTPPNTDRSRPTYVTVMHSARVTGQVVNCSIQMRSDNSTYRERWYLFPDNTRIQGFRFVHSILISTRSGGFFYAWRKYDLHNWLDCGQRQYPDGYWHKFYSGRFTDPRWVHSGHSGKPGTGIPDNGNQQRNPAHRNASGKPGNCSGTAYAILLSDSLSVDGLAQNIAETLTLYQRNMSGFADVMNGAGDVTITINGVAVTVPGQKSLAKKGLTQNSSGGDNTAPGAGRTGLPKRAPSGSLAISANRERNATDPSYKHR
jgi:hypothetical protein